MKSNFRTKAHIHAEMALNQRRCGQDKQAREYWELAKAYAKLAQEAGYARAN